MSWQITAGAVILVLLAVNVLLLWALDRSQRRRNATRREPDGIRRSRSLPAEQSRAHAKADELGWRDQ